MSTTYLNNADGTKLAYNKTDGNGPGIVFLGGFCSDMSGTKALYLQEECKHWGRAYVRFDYFAHGLSDGEFIKGTLTRWLDDVLRVIDELTEGPQILVGSSMGGWLMLLAALKRPERIHALVGIAAAPDFLEDFTRLNDEQKCALETKGVCYVQSSVEGKPYAISANLLDDAKHHYLLQSDITINCPIRLLQGICDADVHWKKAIQIAERVTSKDVNITLFKEGDHRLSSGEQLKVLSDTIKAL